MSPLTNMAGDSDFNQMFFDNVRVPVTNRLGEENRGWYMAVELLDHERASFGDTGQYRRQLDDLRPHIPANGALCVVGPVLRHRYAELCITLEAARWLGYRAAWKADREEEFTIESSATKIMTSELANAVGDFSVRLFGALGLQREDSPRQALDGFMAKRMMWATAQTVYSGTNEIQRGIIATRGLGLPRS
jgi:alkylation response protein AidB-like acyl-CoA dehydrogenase